MYFENEKMNLKNETTIVIIREKYRSLERYLDEKAKRIWAATEARSYGWGGISAVHTALKIDSKTIRKGLFSLENEKSLVNEGIRKRWSEKDFK